MGAGVSEAVFAYAWEGGYVSSREFRAILVVGEVLRLCEWMEGGVPSGFEESLFSRELFCEPTCVLLCCDAAVGEFWAERYKLLEDGWERMEGSDRLAIALDVLSRASAAKVKRVPRVCFEDELSEKAD
jgi:hypothetical protein